MLHPVVPKQQDERFAAVIADWSSELQRLDRYERRALSRRKFAVRALDSHVSATP
jgi:hypothetical protein